MSWAIIFQTKIMPIFVVGEDKKTVSYNVSSIPISIHKTYSGISRTEIKKNVIDDVCVWSPNNNGKVKQMS